MSNSQNMTVYVLAIALALISLLLAFNVTQTEKSLSHSIQVSGEATKTVAPDEAVVYIRSEHTASTAKEAQDMVSEKMDEVMKTLRQYVDSDQIETSHFRVSINQKWNPVQQEYVQEGYTAVHQLEITTQEIDEIGEMIDAAINSGATGVDSVQFQLTRETENKIRSELLEIAGEDAEIKAESIAKGIGVSLGDVIAASESGPYYSANFAYDEAAAVRAEGGEDAGFKTSISPSDIEVRTSVAISYSIK